jgi:ribosome assembly protein YihI (activator of Der GTPase)
MMHVPNSFMKSTTTIQQKKKTRTRKHQERRVRKDQKRDKVHVTRPREGGKNNNNSPNKLHSQFARSNPNDVVILFFMYIKIETKKR